MEGGPALMGVTAEGRRSCCCGAEEGPGGGYLVTTFMEKEGRGRGQEPEEDKVPSPADSQREPKWPD